MLSHNHTLCSGVLLEKLTGSQPVKFSAFYGTRRFITAFTSAMLCEHFATVQEGMIGKLIETGRYYGMEMNVEKNKSNGDFKTTIPSNNYDRPKTTGECDFFFNICVAC